MGNTGSGSQSFLRPLVHLTNNPLSLIGVILVTTAAILLVFLAPSMWGGSASNPYIGILVFMLVPGVFIAGLALIPVGIYLRLRKDKALGVDESNLPPVDLKNTDFRRLLAFVGVTSVVNLLLMSQIGYGATSYMEGVEFCGQTCHTVMEPEFTAYQNSPHSRVECVKCHIGPGAGWFVKSKLSGVRQVFAVALHTYETPIPTPVRNLRPARETCEACHWPQKYGADRLRVISKYADDEKNSLSKTVLLMRIGGGNGGVGIHGVHVAPGKHMRYAITDESRQTIPIVEYDKGDGKWVRYVAQDAKPEVIAKLSDPSTMRTLDCMDCHNRPSHTYQLPERAMDVVLNDGLVSASLPFAKKQGLELIKAAYASHAEAEQKISAGFEKFYAEKYPDIFAKRHDEVVNSGKGVFAAYRRNIFPEMKVTWGAYPNNLGHNDFPGCFRCHDDQHVSQEGQKVTQDCGACHSTLAMDEASPKVLTDLGIAPAPATPAKGPEPKAPDAKPAETKAKGL